MVGSEPSTDLVFDPVPRVTLNPYPGLRPFEPEDADRFFGREAHIDELLTRLAKNRFVAVVGPSGCGKSSLTRAGLIPALLDGMLPDTGMKWAVAIMRPGSNPEGELRDCLFPLLPAPAVQATSESGVHGEPVFDAPRFYIDKAFDGSRDALARAAAQIVLSSPANNVLLLVDQFEELFRFNRRAGDEKEWYERSHRFVQQLLAAVNDAGSGPRGKVYVVLTMRDEFVGRCAAFPGLAEAMNAGLYLVPRLTRTQLADAVRLPAKRCGRVVSPALAERVVNDSIAVQDELPVLQHAMMRTWLTLKPNAREIMLNDYQAVGSVDSALDRHGNEIIGLEPDGRYNDKLSERQRRLCEFVFKRLTLDTGDESTRSHASVKELAGVAGASPDDSDLLHVLDRFRAPDCQFLSPSPKFEPLLTADVEIDLTHEAILRTWQKLGQWAVDERKDAGIYRRLLDMALQYERGPSSDNPLREPQLSAILRWWPKKETWTDAWAARYHPAPSRLRLDGLQRYTEHLKGCGVVPRHVALHDAAWKFLAAARDERDAKILQQEEQAAAEHRRKQRELRQRLLNYILGPALLILGVSATLLLNASRANSEAATQAAENARKETELARQEVSTQTRLTEAHRQKAEANDAALATARALAAENQAKLDAQAQLSVKVKELEAAELKARDEARNARRQATEARREADVAAGELGKFASIKERSKELELELEKAKADNETLRRRLNGAVNPRP